MSNNMQEKVVVLDRSLPMLRLRYCRLIGATQQTSGPTEVPLDETHVKFDEDKINRIVSDVRGETHLNARRARRGKYE